MEKFENWKNSIYWMSWIDFVELELEDYRKANHWKKWTEERYNEAMTMLAEREEIDPEILRREYEA